jgi:peptidoglycan/LPS O-acetylase OafA/YrhL
LQQNTIYFSGLNGVRFIAACFEIIYHTEQIKVLYGLPSAQGSTNTIIGDLGVNVFFVLSGFLITYVLLVEHQKTKTIHIKKFYIRRMLRIWPLYYLITILSFFVFPYFLTISVSTVFDENYTGKLLLFLLFLPNAAIVLYNGVPFASQMWGVGVEEQFYLFWPLFMRLFIKKMWLFLISVIGIFILLRFIAYYILQSGTYNISLFYCTNANDPIPQILRFDCLAIGGIGAYLLFAKKEQILRILFNKYVQIITWVVLLYSIITDVPYTIFYHDVYSLLSLIIIMNIAVNPASLVKLENRFFNYFGKLSYGLYTFHIFCIALVLQVLKNNYPSNLLTLTIVLYLLILTLSIGISMLSHHFFEKRFLNLKKSYSIVVTGDNVQ